MKNSSENFAGVDPVIAKQTIVDFCKKRGALAVGVPDLDTI